MHQSVRTVEARVAALERSAYRWKYSTCALVAIFAVKAFVFAGAETNGLPNQVDQLKVGTLTANHILVADPSGRGGRVIISANDKAANLIVAGYRDTPDHTRQLPGGECAIAAGGESSGLMVLTGSRPDLANFDELAKDPEGITMGATRTSSTLTVTRKGQASKGFVLQPNP